MEDLTKGYDLLLLGCPAYGDEEIELQEDFEEFYEQLDGINLNGKKLEIKLSIEGMSCQHCVGRIKKYLESIANVSDVHVDLDNKKAVFKTEGSIDVDTIVKGISEFGFTAKEQN